MTHQIPKKPFSSTINFHHTCRSIFGTIRTDILNFFLFLLFLFIYDTFFSFFIFLLAFHASPFICSPVFLFSLLLYFSRTSTSPFFLFLFFFPFFPFLSLSLRLLYLFFFPCHSLSAFFFSPPRPLLLRSAVAVEFNLTDEAVAVEISDSDLPLFFFFLPSVVDSMWLWLWVSWFFFKLFSLFSLFSLYIGLYKWSWFISSTYFFLG